MSRKQLKRRADGVVKLTIVGFFILLVACGVGFGVASAEVSDKVASTSAFGFDEATHAATSLNSDEGEEASAAENEAAQSNFDAQLAVLEVSNHRSLDAGFQMIDELEAIEAQRLEEEKAQALERVAANKKKQGIDAENASEDEATDEYGLPSVDWTVGKEAFVAEWTKRINNYLGKSNLGGYGAVFAEAAWENGVDPRWSPAISNTESGMGSVCFLPCNAWGWGSRSWSNWTSAITDHVAGLAEGYGYSLTKSAALRYCPPTYLHWYSVTLEQMRRI